MVVSGEHVGLEGKNIVHWHEGNHEWWEYQDVGTPSHNLEYYSGIRYVNLRVKNFFKRLFCKHSEWDVQHRYKLHNMYMEEGTYTIEYEYCSCGMVRKKGGNVSELTARESTLMVLNTKLLASSKVRYDMVKREQDFQQAELGYLYEGMLVDRESRQGYNELIEEQTTKIQKLKKAEIQLKKDMDYYTNNISEYTKGQSYEDMQYNMYNQQEEVTVMDNGEERRYRVDGVLAETDSKELMGYVTQHKDQLQADGALYVEEEYHNLSGGYMLCTGYYTVKQGGTTYLRKYEVVLKGETRYEEQYVPVHYKLKGDNDNVREK